jgi:hypothetical protein
MQPLAGSPSSVSAMQFQLCTLCIYIYIYIAFVFSGRGLCPDRRRPAAGRPGDSDCTCGDAHPPSPPSSSPSALQYFGAALSVIDDKEDSVSVEARCFASRRSQLRCLAGLASRGTCGPLRKVFNSLPWTRADPGAADQSALDDSDRIISPAPTRARKGPEWDG